MAPESVRRTQDAEVLRAAAADGDAEAQFRLGAMAAAVHLGPERLYTCEAEAGEQGNGTIYSGSTYDRRESTAG